MDKSKLSMSKLSSAKSLFVSKTFWGAIFTAIVAIAPTVGEAVDNRRISGKDIAEIVGIIAGAGVTIVGRTNAKTAIFTPRGLPGPNKDSVSPRV